METIKSTALASARVLVSGENLWALIDAYADAHAVYAYSTERHLAKQQRGNKEHAKAELVAALASQAAPQAAQCNHRIADARNPVVKSGYLCVDCGALFSAADHCEKAAPQAGRSVVFIGIDPLNIDKGAVLPMIPDSWRMGFFTTGDNLLHFGYLDDGPLVAWEAVKDLAAPQSDCRKYCQREAEELSAPAPAVAVGALTDEKIRQLAVDHGVIAFHPDPKLTAFARALIADQSARAPAGEPVADIIALADWFKRERPSGMHATLFRNAEAKLRALATSAAPVANAGQAQDDGQQHDDPTGPNHPGHHDGMTCERAAQVIVDLTEDQYPGSRGNFSNRIKRVYGESEYASWKPQAAQPTGGERAAFEAEMQRIGYNMTMEAKKPGQYAFPPMRAAWHAWQARAAISAQQKP